MSQKITFEVEIESDEALRKHKCIVEILETLSDHGYIKVKVVEGINYPYGHGPGYRSPGQIAYPPGTIINNAGPGEVTTTSLQDTVDKVAEARRTSYQYGR